MRKTAETRALEALVDTLQKQRDRLRERVTDADKEERRLTEANCRLQLEVHDLAFERHSLFQALSDCQRVRNELEDRVQSLELSNRRAA